MTIAYLYLGKEIEIFMSVFFYSVLQTLYYFLCSDGVKSRTRTHSEAETFSSSSLLNTQNGKNARFSMLHYGFQ